MFQLHLCCHVAHAYLRHSHMHNERHAAVHLRSLFTCAKNIVPLFTCTYFLHVQWAACHCVNCAYWNTTFVICSLLVDWTGMRVAAFQFTWGTEADRKVIVKLHHLSLFFTCGDLLRSLQPHLCSARSWFDHFALSGFEFCCEIWRMAMRGKNAREAFANDKLRLR